jgi:uncharacterized membrane protein
MVGSVVAGTVGYVAASSAGLPVVGVGLYWAGVAGMLAVWQGTSVPLFDERDRALERRAIAIAATVFTLGMILLWPTLVVLSELEVYTPPPVFDGVLLAVGVQAGLFAVVYGWLRYR